MSLVFGHSHMGTVYMLCDSRVNMSEDLCYNKSGTKFLDVPEAKYLCAGDGDMYLIQLVEEYVLDSATGRVEIKTKKDVRNIAHKMLEVFAEHDIEREKEEEPESGVPSYDVAITIASRGVFYLINPTMMIERSAYTIASGSGSHVAQVAYAAIDKGLPPEILVTRIGEITAEFHKEVGAPFEIRKLEQ